MFRPAGSASRRLRGGLCALVTAGVVGVAASGAAAQTTAGEGDAANQVSFVTEQLLLVATIVGTIAALPALIDFVIERRKRRERIALSIEDEAVEALKPRLAGMDGMLGDIADLIDRAREPAAYAQLKVGNEILILGSPLSGKKTFAQRVAKEARLDRLITVYNPRNVDALAKAKSLVHAYRRQKVMLLIPRIDLAFDDEDEDILTELDALIESTSERSNVLVVATAIYFEPDSQIDNLFGIKLVMPGTPQEKQAQPRDTGEETRRVLAEVARYYLKESGQGGASLVGLDEQEFVTRIVSQASNPAEVEDIVVLCQTSALHRRRTGAAKGLEITPEVLERAIHRVIVNLVYRHE